MLSALWGPPQSALQEVDSDRRLQTFAPATANAPTNTAAAMPQNIFLLFAGISTLICAILFMIFCLCDLLERRQKRRREVQLVEQLVEQMLTPVGVSRYQPVAPPPRPSHPPEEPLRPARSCPPPVPPPPTGVSAPDSAVFGKPPCYEEAVLMEYPPPPYTAGPWPTPSEAENAGFPVQPSQPRAAALA